MYPKNNASPPKLFASVVNAADGAPITSGVAAKYSTGAGSQAAGGGTCQHEGNGQWSYAPTQAETNVNAFGIQFYHADAVGDGPTVSVVTTPANASLQPQVDLVSILGTALTETAGQIAAAFKKFFDVATPTGTVDSIPDAVAGAAGGLAIVGSEMVLAAAYDAAKTAAQAGDEMDFVDAPNTTAISAIQANLATAANQTTILDRLGAFTGSGINTVLGFLRALGAKAAALTPSDLSSGTTFDNTTDSQEAIRDRGDAAWITGGAGLTQQDVRDAMKLAPTAGAPAAGSVDEHLDDMPADVDTQLSSVHGAGAWGAGTGASSVVYTVTAGGAPLAGVYCRFTTDAAGSNNVDAGTTDALGQVTFHHDLATGTTVYVWRSLAGYEFTDPDTEVIP